MQKNAVSKELVTFITGRANTADDKLGIFFLTFVLLNKLRCRSHFYFTANQMDLIRIAGSTLFAKQGISGFSRTRLTFQRKVDFVFHANANCLSLCLFFFLKMICMECLSFVFWEKLEEKKISEVLESVRTSY